MHAEPPFAGRPITPLFRLWREPRANVALLAALLLPVFIGAAGLGVEASSWSVLQTRLQRTADMAALAASVVYSSSLNYQTAALAAADIIELNGFVADTRSWIPATKTLTEGAITVQQVSGIRKGSDPAFKVTVHRTVSPVFAKLFVSATSYTVPASATAELVSIASAQPCIVALGTTSTAISVSGSTTITATGCSARSNGGVSLTGSSSITAASVYAGSSIAISGTSAVHATTYPNNGTIPDPYANSTRLQDALHQLGSCPACTAVSLSHVDSPPPISPGSYSSISVVGNSTLTLNAGLYVVNGPVTVSNGARMSGSGVTIVASGPVTFNGDGAVNLTAPGTSPVGNAVSGVVIAGTSTSTTTFGNSATPKLTGMIYYPNGNLTISGAVSYGATSCLEMIAKTVTLTGSASFSSNCSSLGALSFGSINGSTASLVE
jgi:Flp pilus assembly protein TadG